jgi:hypothetical protein
LNDWRTKLGRRRRDLVQAYLAELGWPPPSSEAALIDQDA